MEELIRFAWENEVETANLAEAYMVSTLDEIQGISQEQREEARRQIDEYFTKERADARKVYAGRLNALEWERLSTKPF